MNLQNIDAIFVTHEHTDHTKSLGLISSKYNIPIFATKGTWDAFESNKILEDVFEALVGAIYLDQGIEVAAEYLNRFLLDDIKK